MSAEHAARFGRERVDASVDVPCHGAVSRPGDETSALSAARLARKRSLESTLAGAIEDNAKLRAAIARIPKTCPIFGHTDATRRRRVDCADEQCRNPECVRYVECEHWSHDLVDALDAEHGANRGRP